MTVAPSMCSTPCGITDHIGPYGSGRAGDTCSAQRLAASRIISVGHDRLASGQCVCSTPCGITDHIGRRLRLWLHPRLVLNALRHHGSYRDVPGFHLTIRSSAQRLAASRIISDTLAAIGLDGDSQCSTPCGITDHIGDRRAAGIGRRMVLNALRHHGSYRRAVRFDTTRSPCSAQRLAASRIISELSRKRFGWNNKKTSSYAPGVPGAGAGVDASAPTPYSLL